MISKNLLNILFLTNIIQCEFYNGKYFDVTDRMKADCVRLASRPSYDYIGNLDRASSGEQCAPWMEVLQYWYEKANDDEKRLLSLPERVSHSKCRLVKLPVTHKFAKLSTSGTSKLVPSGSQGPWCYIKAKGKVGNVEFDYLAKDCFKNCVTDTPDVANVTKKRISNSASLRLNYNIEVLDPIHRMFKKYYNEEKEYYEYKPSILDRPEYKTLQREIFLALFMIFVAVIFWILIYQILRRKARKLDRKREKLLDELYDTTNVADVKMHLELERESMIQ